MKKNYIIADGRWLGQHGIGRFSAEVLYRLQNTDILTKGPKPLSLKNLAWLPYKLNKSKQHKVFFAPGFNPVIYSPIPFVFTICDLIHLDFPGNYKIAKQIYYQYFIKYRTKQAYKIITISEYSRKKIIEWANIPEKNVVNVSCGVSQHLTPEGVKYTPNFPYLLHIGNSRPHKNVDRLLHAFANAKIYAGIKLILTGEPTPDITQIIKTTYLEERVIFSGKLTENQLAEYYRGAVAVVFPSLAEGFGLPVVEAMASGTPVLTSNVTSLPEIAGDAAILVDPYDIDSIAVGIENIVNDNPLRENLITKGFQQAKLFSWDKTAFAVQEILDECL